MEHYGGNTTSEQVSILQNEVIKLTEANVAKDKKYYALLCESQEESFRRMKPGRWQPPDTQEVLKDLNSLKLDIRRWAKDNSIQEHSMIQPLSKLESAALIKNIGNVAFLENGELPEELFTAKLPMILLSALFSYSIYTSSFRSPFFFLSNNTTNAISELVDIYKQAIAANYQDAYIWRSDTLRMLMPPLGYNLSDAEIQLRCTTEGSIAQAADQQASTFLDSPVSYLIEDKTKTKAVDRLKRIYNDAAKISYMLWTRRIEIKCFTLHEIDHSALNIESEDFEPDRLVRYNDHEDHLKGRRIAVMMHPILKVYGTDEAKDYEECRVWVKGVVWLNNLYKK